MDGQASIPVDSGYLLVHLVYPIASQHSRFEIQSQIAIDVGVLAPLTIRFQRGDDSGRAQYRLPTEAEWEYAARGGGKAEAWAGTSQASELGDYAWFIENAMFQTHPVGKKKPNRPAMMPMPA